MKHLNFIFVLLAVLCITALLTNRFPEFQSVYANSKCSVSDKLVNACRPWFGANVNHYSEAGKGIKNQILYFEKRLGRQVDIAHTYHNVGDNHLSEDDLFFINRPNTHLMTNWKPATFWKDAGGSSVVWNKAIDEMAKSVKAVAPKKIFLTIYHEPEDQVTEGSVAACKQYSNKPKAGTPSEYRAMWANVRKRFDAMGVKNVVWVMNYMSYPKWNCMVDELWPGNNLVDWVTWDPYAHEPNQWPAHALTFYQFLSQHSNASHNYLSKPWGLNEFGAQGEDAFVIQQYQLMKQGLDKNTMPRLKMYNVFDNNDLKQKRDSRIGYNDKGKLDPKKQKAFNQFANHPKFLAR